MGKMLDYAIVVEPLSAEDGGGWLASVPALPGCMGDGETPEAAIQDARDAFEAWVEARLALGLPIPKPGVQVSGKLLARLPKS